MHHRSFDLRKKRLVDLDGFRLYVMPNDYIGMSIASARSYEPHVTAVIRRELRPGDVFLDVGANIGYFTLMASSIVGDAGRVIAFEPNPQNLQLIYASLLHANTRNVTVFPLAVSDRQAILRFLTVGSNGGVVNEHSKYQDHTLLVPAVRGDDLLPVSQRVDLLKIDVEAHESAAIRGMERLIRAQRPAIITEYHPWAIELNSPEPAERYLQQLLELGYELSVIAPAGDLLSMDGADAITRHWRTLGSETAHLDLFARPAS